jgi:type IV pilus assembly protein PilW
MNTHPTRGVGRLRARQQGFTLVELSVALLIGLFLLGGLLTLVQDMHRTFGNQNQLAQLQDNERLAMTLITDVIQGAGYYPNPTFYTITSALPAVGAFTSNGQAIAGTHNAAAPGDTISVQFLTASNDGMINCTGGSNTTGGPVLYINKFSVNAANKQLWCTLNNNAPVVLITGVTNLQILYGVNGTGTISNVDRFLTASQMTVADWTHVICVKVTLTFDNSVLHKSDPGQPATIPFTRVITVMSQGGVNTA